MFDQNDAQPLEQGTTPENNSNENNNNMASLLEQEGLHYEGYVDIFDAGPVLQARLDALRAVRDSRLFSAEIATTEIAASAQPMLVASTSLAEFCVTVQTAAIADARLPLALQTLQLIGCELGDPVRALPLNPNKSFHA